MFPTKHDGLLLRLFWLGLRNRFLEIRFFDRLFFLFGGILCILWPLSDFRDFLHDNAEALCGLHWIWVAGPVVFGLFGAGIGWRVTGLALTAAAARYLQSQPIARHARRRMAGFAALACSVCLAPAAATIAAIICRTLDKPQPVLWGMVAALAYMSGTALGLSARIWLRREISDHDQPLDSPAVLPLPLPGWLQRLDRARPAWIGFWAIGLEHGSLPLSVARVLGFLFITLAAMLPMAAGFARHQAAPAAAGAVLTGFVAFMLVVRCQPLSSAVLRTAPIGFVKAWLGMLRLPLAFSAIFFMVPAGAALAAEPSSWAMPVSGGFGLLVLDGAYAIFAAFFLMSPSLAALSFFAVVFYASYKWVTYHALVYACFAALLALMASRVRRSFYHGR